MLKQFVIVPKKPKMSTGKIASQVAHATFMAIKKQREISEFDNDLINKWEKEGMCVIVLQCSSQIELINIDKYCYQWEVPKHLYIDEGLTEIPMGTATCLATGVIPEERQWMFKQLNLFK